MKETLQAMLSSNLTSFITFLNSKELSIASIASTPFPFTLLTSKTSTPYMEEEN